MKNAKSFESGRAGWCLTRYELDGQTLSTSDLIALIALRLPQKAKIAKFWTPVGPCA